MPSSRAAMLTPSRSMSSPSMTMSADMHADPELQPAFLRHVGVAGKHPALDVDGAAHRVDDARELGQQAVARGLHDAPAMRHHLRVEQQGAVRPELPDRVSSTTCRAVFRNVGDDVVHEVEELDTPSAALVRGGHLACRHFEGGKQGRRAVALVQWSAMAGQCPSVWQLQVALCPFQGLKLKASRRRR